MARKEKAIRGSRMPDWFLANDISEFATKYSLMLKALPKVKTLTKPKFDAMFSRKFMVLVYLSGIEQEKGHFSIFSIQEHFRQGSGVYATSYFNRLLNEGWITAINTHYPKHREAVLSPLFFSLIQSLTTFLRREHPEQYAKRISAQVEALPADIEPSDIVQDIPDLR